MCVDICLELSESITWFRVIGLQLGVEYVSRAAHKEDRGLTAGRRHQLKVLAGDDNIKGDRKKKICRFLTSNCKSDKQFGIYQSKFRYTVIPVPVSVAI
jgi:hypothetical protein